MRACGCWVGTCVCVLACRACVSLRVSLSVYVCLFVFLCVCVVFVCARITWVTFFVAGEKQFIANITPAFVERRGIIRVGYVLPLSAFCVLFTQNCF